MTPSMAGPLMAPGGNPPAGGTRGLALDFVHENLLFLGARSPGLPAAFTAASDRLRRSWHRSRTDSTVDVNGWSFRFSGSGGRLDRSSGSARGIPGQGRLFLR